MPYTTNSPAVNYRTNGDKHTIPTQHHVGVMIRLEDFFYYKRNDVFAPISHALLRVLGDKNEKRRKKISHEVVHITKDHALSEEYLTGKNKLVQCKYLYDKRCKSLVDFLIKYKGKEPTKNAASANEVFECARKVVAKDDEKLIKFSKENKRFPLVFILEEVGEYFYAQ